MRKPPQSERLYLDGPAGTLETLVEWPAGADAAGAAVVCHPHPMHGGTMQNKVAHTLARAFLGRGYAAARFNFRGVGESDGSFDEGRGEILDALAVIDSVRERYPGLPLWLAGFSFGAAIAIRAAAEQSASGLVSVAPAITRVKGSAAAQPDCPWLIIQGDRDELVDVEETVEWVNTLSPGPELQVFADTEHFFHGKLLQLRDAVESFVDRHAARR